MGWSNQGGWRDDGWARPAAASGPWTPASLPNLVGWWKADAGVYTDMGTTLATNGQTVEQWQDQSGNGLHVSQGSGVTRPTYFTNTLNSLPVIDFNAASNQYLSTLQTPGTPTFNGGTHLSIFILFKCTAVSGNTRVIGVSHSADTAADAAVIFMNTITNPYTYSNGFLSNCTIVSGSWNENVTIFDGVNDTMYLANVAQTPAASAPTFSTTERVFMGSDESGSFTLTGQVAEAGITTAAIGTSDLASLRTYLLGRWGV